MKIHMILLAAGRGSRFGGGKLMYEIEGKPMYRHMLERLALLRDRLPADRRPESGRLPADRQLKSGRLPADRQPESGRLPADRRPESGRLVAVTADKRLEAGAAALGAACIRNEHQDRGLSFSIRLGLEACGEPDGTESCAYLFCPADQPWFSLQDLEGLIEGWLASGKGIGMPVRKGRSGSPCIFDSRYRAQLLALSGDIGGKSIAKAYPEEVYLYEIAEQKGLEDIDYRPETEDNAGKGWNKG